MFHLYHEIMKNYKNVVNYVLGLFFITASFLFAESATESTINNTNHFFSCIVYNDDWYYGGDMVRIPVSKDLTDDNDIINEAVFAADLQQDLEKSEELYNGLAESLNGKILDTDIARNLYEPYANSIDDRHHYVSSTLMPAAFFVDYLYYKRLVELIALNTSGFCIPNIDVVLLAGGDGSGKTSSVQRLDLPLLKKAAFIKDSTMTSDFEYHRDMIEKTIESNLKVTVIYVFRPIELALIGNIQRAQVIGRVRPLIEISNAHYRAQQNVLELHEYFGDKIEVIVIDNSRSFEEVHLVDDSIAFIKSAEVYYESQDIVQERALIAYNNLDKAEVPEFIRNLLERKLDPTVFSDENYQSKSEKARWLNYLKNVISAISKKLGF